MNIVEGCGFASVALFVWLYAERRNTLFLLLVEKKGNEHKVSIAKGSGKRDQLSIIQGPNRYYRSRDAAGELAYEPLPHKVDREQCERRGEDQDPGDIHEHAGRRSGR